MRPGALVRAFDRLPAMRPATAARKICLGLRHPPLVGVKVNAFLNRHGGARTYNPGGVDVFAEDGDNLLVLDACRADLFEAVAIPELEGHYETRESRGAATPEFLRGNFHARDLTDTVYVTGNPQLHWKRDRIQPHLHATVHVWQDETGWDERYETVLPETMAEYTRWAAAQYPNKRLVVHFMQPHFPFLTDETKFDKGHLESDDDVFHMWMQLMTGQLELTAAELRALFADNLRRALPAVERAIDLLDGRTVVTSDHGNMHGERSWPIPVRVWGHPPGIYHPALVEVPWLISEGEDRRRIVAEPPVSDPTDGTDTDVGDRLRRLGYAE